MVAKQSCVKRLWSTVLELYHDGYRGTTGALGAIPAAGRQCVTSCKLSDLVSGDSSWYDDFGCLDGGHACAWETLNFRWRRRVMEELELRHVVLLGSSLARTACTDGKRPRNQCSGHAERTPHSSRAGVEQTDVLHAQSEYERRIAEETTERARGERGAEAWKVFSEHYEPKTATRYVGMLRQILLYNFGEFTHNSSIGWNNSGTLSGSTRNRAGSP